MTIELDMEMMRMAYGEARRASTDPRTQNGAIIRSSTLQSVVAVGANHFPRSVQETEDRWKRPIKYYYAEHAERNAIYQAARLGHSTFGCTM